MAVLNNPTFDPKELEVVAKLPGTAGNPDINVYNFPVTPKAAYKALFSKKPIWQITTMEMVIFTPKCVPDNVARGFVIDGTHTPPTGGADMFGIEWEYVPQVGGSMVRPGKPFAEDANEIADKIKWPDIDAWDWSGSVEANQEYLSTDRFVFCWLMNGWYERLISLMDFEGAVVAMIDEDQTEAVKAFFDKLTDLYIRILGKYLTHFPQIDGFVIHDDWGGQKETFFSPAVVAEMIVPYMKRVTDYLHAKGKICEFHSCGQLMKQIPNMIAAGWDAWNPQLLNDTARIYELYGDKMLIGVTAEPLSPSSSEEEQRAKAREYADKFCNPDKPCILNRYSAPPLTPAFREELYKQSRIKFGG